MSFDVREIKFARVGAPDNWLTDIDGVDVDRERITELIRGGMTVVPLKNTLSISGTFFSRFVIEGPTGESLEL